MITHLDLEVSYDIDELCSAHEDSSDDYRATITEVVYNGFNIVGLLTPSDVERLKDEAVEDWCRGGNGKLSVHATIARDRVREGIGK